MTVSLEECLPTPIGASHEILQDTIEDLRSLGAPQYFITEVSFYIGRLWTYSVCVEKPFAMMFGGDMPSCIVLCKIENQQHLVSTNELPVRGLMAIMFFKKAVQVQYAVFFHKLQSLIFK